MAFDSVGQIRREIAGFDKALKTKVEIDADDDYYGYAEIVKMSEEQKAELMAYREQMVALYRQQLELTKSMLTFFEPLAG